MKQPFTTRERKIMLAAMVLTTWAFVAGILAGDFTRREGIEQKERIKPIKYTDGQLLQATKGRSGGCVVLLSCPLRPLVD